MGPKGRSSARLCLLLALLSGAASGCGNTSFGGSGNKAAPAVAPPPDPRDYPLTTSCKDDVSTTHILTLDGTGPWTATFTGSLCPAPATTGLHVALLIDVSYSMRGIDPQLEGNCGRFAAGKALLQSLRTTATDPTQVHLSIVHFSSAAVVKVQDVLLSAADAVADVQLFCYSELETTGFTNYKAAFDILPTLMLPSDITRVTYLMTDGVPTTGGDAASGFVDDVDESMRRLARHAEASRQAFFAANIAAAEKPWTLNALFLGSRADYSMYAFDPEAFLAALTGETQRVIVVSQASALAAAIIALPFGVPGVATGSATATLRHAGQETPLTVTSMAPDTSGATWTFNLSPAMLDPTPGLEHEIVVNATDLAGRPLESRVKIDAVRP